MAIFPNVDALSELKVHTGIYSAEFGRSLGGCRQPADEIRRQRVFAVTPSSFSVTTALDANDWFNNRARRPHPDFGQHQFGATTGRTDLGIARSSSPTTRACASIRT